jgi:hypothetical protein
MNRYVDTQTRGEYAAGEHSDLDTMNTFPNLVAGQIGLLVGPKAEREAMFRVVSILALRGPVSVLDGGNCFNAFRVARYVRSQTPHLDVALDRISVARAFTCYQVVSLFEQTPATEAPKLVLDLLSTFCDESVTVPESERLLRIVIDHLLRFKRLGPVMVSIRPPPQPERIGLVDIVSSAADQVYARDIPVEPVTPTLF